MKNAKRISFILFLAVSVIVLWEYLFVRGMFTAVLAMAAVAVVGVLNLILEVKDGQWKSAALYAIATIALACAYLPWFA